MADQHDRVIAEAAHAALSSLGLVRKGRSRIWLDDQSWWLGIADFKPSNREPGAYLNVGLMFLWHPAAQYIFEIGGQLEGFSPADSTGFVLRRTRQGAACCAGARNPARRFPLCR
jgi:hypothetical protein